MSEELNFLQIRREKGLQHIYYIADNMEIAYTERCYQTTCDGLILVLCSLVVD